uniref:Uncharacterized protein n=1 Tax=Octopus bimaculoides TaxID=37653 RepID=A0A0L8HY33_OCTBM
MEWYSITMWSVVPQEGRGSKTAKVSAIYKCVLQGQKYLRERERDCIFVGSGNTV